MKNWELVLGGLTGLVTALVALLASRNQRKKIDAENDQSEATAAETIQRASMKLLETYEAHAEDHAKLRRKLSSWLPHHRKKFHAGSPEDVPDISWFDDETED